MHRAVRVAQLAVGARGQPDARAASARRATAERAARRLVGVADAAQGERALDRPRT